MQRLLSGSVYSPPVSTVLDLVVLLSHFFFGTVPTTSEVVYHIDGRAVLLRVDRTLSRVTMILSSHRPDSTALLGTDDNRWATNATKFPDTIITTVDSLVNESISNVMQIK